MYHQQYENHYGSKLTPRLYSIWRGINKRVRFDASKKRERYRKRGMCEEWHFFVPFRDWALSHGYADGLTIDRIDNDKGYSPENCQWLTMAENLRKDQKGKWKTTVTYKGETRLLRELCEEMGIAVTVVWSRMGMGWSLEEALETPLQRIHGMTYKGKTKSLREWAEQYKLPETTLYARLKRGWSIKDALTTPIQQRKGKR